MNTLHTFVIWRQKQFARVSVFLNTWIIDHESSRLTSYLSFPCSFEITCAENSGILKIRFWLNIEVLLWKWLSLNRVICVQNGTNGKLPVSDLCIGDNICARTFLMSDELISSKILQFAIASSYIALTD